MSQYMLGKSPRVTIVTPSLNQSKYLKQTVESVLSQDYRYVEYLVVDGGSTDGTLSLLESYSDRLTWISEADSGQADAINKGFERSSGDIFGWLNADDQYTKGAIRRVVSYLAQYPEAIFVYGNALAINAKGRCYGLRPNVGPCTLADLLRNGDYIVQPAAFWRRDLWETIGPLNDALHYVLDYEYWIRAAHQYELHFIPDCLAMERIYASTKTSSGGAGRIDELASLMASYNQPQLPYRFRSEAAATWLLDGVRLILQGKTTEGKEAVTKSFDTTGNFFKYVAYLMFLTLFGSRGTVMLRLAYSWFLGRSECATVNEVETQAVNSF